MKNSKGKLLFFFALTFLTSITAYPQSLFDDFNGSSVNTSIWNEILPFSQSQITQSGGTLTTTGRGTLATVQGFTGSYTVSGAVTLNNGFEHFGVTLRSDLTTNAASGLSQFYVLTGILVEFSADGDQVSIQQIDSSNPNPPILTEASFDFTVGQLYDYSITDTGSEISLAIDGNNLISSDTTFSTGQQIAFQSREFGNTSSSMDFVQIAPVPEPTNLMILGLGSMPLFGMLKGRRQINLK